jgi:hypothetical protein
MKDEEHVKEFGLAARDSISSRKDEVRGFAQTRAVAIARLDGAVPSVGAGAPDLMPMAMVSPGDAGEGARFGKGLVGVLQGITILQVT